MWFNKTDLQNHSIITVNDLYGYVLPHAGTKYTGHIISHTLRFRPTKKIKQIIILYYPSSSTPTITINETNNELTQSYFHEYYVPWKSINHIFNDTTIDYIGINITTLINKLNGKENFINLKNKLNLEHTLLVVSADFSHFLPFDEAHELETKAAHSLMFRNVKSSPFIDIVDDVKTFTLVYKLLPKKCNLQWVGRTRSSGERGVGYLSFLIREKPSLHLSMSTTITPFTKTHLPDGMFVTAYDATMTTRECLGQWFTNTHKNKSWSTFSEQTLVEKVIRLATTTSRLTGGKNRNIPVLYYTITYLYKDMQNEFIRGWHGILYNAFYLPDVFLENTFNNGTWITNEDTMWQKGTQFNLTETFQKLNSKAGISFINQTSTKVSKKKSILNTIHSNTKPYTKPYTLYSSKVSHFTIT